MTVMDLSGLGYNRGGSSTPKQRIIRDRLLQGQIVQSQAVVDDLLSPESKTIFVDTSKRSSYSDPKSIIVICRDRLYFNASNHDDLLRCFNSSFLEVNSLKTQIHEAVMNHQIFENEDVSILSNAAYILSSTWCYEEQVALLIVDLHQPDKWTVLLYCYSDCLIAFLMMMNAHKRALPENISSKVSLSSEDEQSENIPDDSNLKKTTAIVALARLILDMVIVLVGLTLDTFVSRKSKSSQTVDNIDDISFSIGSLMEKVSKIKDYDTSGTKKHIKDMSLAEDHPPSENTLAVEDPPPTTKDHPTDADSLHPSTHSRRVEGSLDGGPYLSDNREFERTGPGVSSGEEDLVLPTVCQDEHQDQVVVNGHVRPTSSDANITFLQSIPPPPAPREEGCRVLLSNVPEFSEGERVPCPSRVVRNMQRVRHGRGFRLYHKNKAFIAEETATPLDQLEVWSGLHHRRDHPINPINVLKLSAVLGDCDGHPETSYQLTPVFTGDLKHLMTKCHLPSLRECLSSLFSDRVDLILWNAKYILREILKGLKYLHEDEGIIHGNLKLQNILVDVHCNCEDIFQCPHKGDSGYRVYISDFDQAVRIREGGATEWDDMSSFGLLLMEIFGITKVDECTAVERECVGLEGLYDVVSACHEINLEDIPGAAKLLQHSFFSFHQPGGVCDSTPPPWSPPDSCVVEDSSPPLAVQAQQEPHDEGCKKLLGVKTPEKLAHLLTSKHSQSVAPYNISQSAVVEVVQSKDPSPILNHSSCVSSVDSGSKNCDRVRPTQHDSRTMNMYPNNTSKERDALMAELKAKQRAEEGIVTQSRSGAVVFSRCGDFPRDSSAPLPSKKAMSDFIGKGGNGVVSYVYHNGKEFAVKETCLRDDELLTLAKLSHRNVMEISAVIEGERHERYQGGKACYQLMPRVTGDVKKMMEDKGMPTLCHYFFKFKTESDKASYVLGNAKFILREALSGLQYLHKIGVAHRDVKLQNILVDVHCNCEDIFQCPHEGESGYRVYISDFDSVLDVERTRKRLEKRSEMRLPVRYSVHGTPGYRPPEACYYCSSNKVIPSYLSTSQDIWSFGCTLMKFFVGSSGPSTQKELSSVKISHCLQQQPRYIAGVQPSLRHSLTVGEKEMKKFLKVSLLEKYFPLATELHDITQGCLKVNPTQRPKVEEILKHPFFKASNSS